jgi:hypothetical protein
MPGDWQAKMVVGLPLVKMVGLQKIRKEPSFNDIY